jgi:hypothetical protein
MSDRNINDKFINTNIVNSENVTTQNLYSKNIYCDTYTTDNLSASNIYSTSMNISNLITIQNNGLQTTDMILNKSGSTALEIYGGTGYVQTIDCDNLNISEIQSSSNITSNKLTINDTTNLSKVNNTGNSLVVTQGNIGITGNSEIKKQLNNNSNLNHNINNIT